MFEEVSRANDPLLQGDLCRHVWFPAFVNNTAVLAGSGQKEQPWSGETRPKFFLVEPRRRTVLVLSQSCDLERLSSGGGGGILICPLVSEEESSVLDDWNRERKKDEYKNLDQQIALGGAAGTKAQKAYERLEKMRNEALKRLWLGELVGAFPTQRVGTGGEELVERSVVHFDMALNVPTVPWLELLKGVRIRHMNHEWRSILQDGLSRWLGRFAFSGSTEDRLKVGGLDE